MFYQINTNFDLLLILKTNKLTQDTGFCRYICREKLRSSVSYNGCKMHLGFKMCINFHMHNPFANIHRNVFSGLLFREAVKKNNSTNSLVASFLFS